MFTSVECRKKKRKRTIIAVRVSTCTGMHLAFFGSFLLGKVLLHYRPHWCLVHSCGLLAFLTPFGFHLLHRLVTCRPFSVKLSPSGTDCLLLSSLLRLSLFLSISSSTPVCLWYVHLWSILVIFSHSFGRLPHYYLYFFFRLCSNTILFLVFFLCYFISQRRGPRLVSCYWPILFKHICSINK